MILIVGASGMLGRSMVVALSGSGAAIPICVAPSHSELDITNELAVYKYIKQIRPTSIINCAAMTDVDACEVDIDKAYNINGFAVEYLAKAARKVHAKFIQISSDYVHDGSKFPVTEDDATNPIQEYGKSKLLGEIFALENEGIVARVQWLFGRHKQNFVNWVIGNIQQNNAMQISTDQIGCPSSTDWVARTVLMMASHPNIKKGSIYNVTHDDFCSRYECAVCAVQSLGVANIDSFLIPTTGTKFGKAPRPTQVHMSSEKLKKALEVPTLGSWKQDVNSFVINNWKLK